MGGKTTALDNLNVTVVVIEEPKSGRLADCAANTANPTVRFNRATLPKSFLTRLWPGGTPRPPVPRAGPRPRQYAHGPRAGLGLRRRQNRRPHHLRAGQPIFG